MLGVKQLPTSIHVCIKPLKANIKAPTGPRCGIDYREAV